METQEESTVAKIRFPRLVGTPTFPSWLRRQRRFDGSGGRRTLPTPASRWCAELTGVRWSSRLEIVNIQIPHTCIGGIRYPTSKKCGAIAVCRRVAS